MTTRLKPVDAVMVGFGWTSAIMGQQLADAGLSIVALERGPWRDTATDFPTTFAQDEATSVVYGMPKAAWELGAAQRQLPLGQIASYILEHHEAAARGAPTVSLNLQ